MQRYTINKKRKEVTLKKSKAGEFVRWSDVYDLLFEISCCAEIATENYHVIKNDCIYKIEDIIE